jgi:hypothetical protein
VTVATAVAAVPTAISVAGVAAAIAGAWPGAAGISPPSPDSQDCRCRAAAAVPGAAVAISVAGVAAALPTPQVARRRRGDSHRCSGRAPPRLVPPRRRQLQPDRLSSAAVWLSLLRRGSEGGLSQSPTGCQPCDPPRQLRAEPYDSIRSEREIYRMQGLAL